MYINAYISTWLSLQFRVHVISAEYYLPPSAPASNGSFKRRNNNSIDTALTGFHITQTCL